MDIIAAPSNTKLSDFLLRLPGALARRFSESLLELKPFNKLVRFEELSAAHRFAAEREVFEGEAFDAGLFAAPEDLGLADHAGGGDGDVLEEDAGEVAGAALV